MATRRILPILLIAFIAGCGGTPEVASEPERTLISLPPKPADDVTFDYTQEPLAEISEEARAENIEMRFPLPKGIADTERGPAPPSAPPGDPFDHRLKGIPGARPLQVLDPRLDTDLRFWTAVGPEYSPYADSSGGRTVVVTRRWQPMPIGNTLFFGTLGGIIGHQSDHRDKGILLGAGTGLILDLIRW